MQPSSSTDPNAPYRAAIASLVNCNFFPDQNTDQLDLHNAASQHSPLAQLSPRKASSSNDFSAVTGPSSSSSPAPAPAPRATIKTIKDYLRGKQLGLQPIKDRTLINRLNSANLSAETLFTALVVAENTNHPLWTTLNVSIYERYEVFNRLIVIAGASNGYHGRIRTVVENSNNDPETLIANLSYYLRNLKH